MATTGELPHTRPTEKLVRETHPIRAYDQYVQAPNVDEQLRHAVARRAKYCAVRRWVLP
ncbi:hypothetical protein [Mycolicibacterium sp. HK-90]|uniref:hypothetical protein n=1 Tax=Mycolicibacterium sp. HK-90 TaxID=3056937 RepID=UPI00265A691B|nr:hypothetical protein [Mycolicibacterium sp. HK-90]WKG03624.1 hypothetical protein QU592_00275 [Mycolicibacterium sp. HK-90]